MTIRAIDKFSHILHMIISPLYHSFYFKDCRKVIVTYLNHTPLTMGDFD